MGTTPPHLMHPDCLSDDPEAARRAQLEDIARLRADIAWANRMTAIVIGSAIVGALVVFVLTALTR